MKMRKSACSALFVENHCRVYLQQRQKKKTWGYDAQFVGDDSIEKKETWKKSTWIAERIKCVIGEEREIIKINITRGFINNKSAFSLDVKRQCALCAHTCTCFKRNWDDTTWHETIHNTVMLSESLRTSNWNCKNAGLLLPLHWT